MNEDDTFKFLKRTPIRDLDSEYQKRFLDFYSDPDMFKEWLEKYGWEEKEFLAAGSAYVKQTNERRRHF
jgi:hypothetical protein